MRERLGRYIIVQELGEGQPGSVYRASDDLHSQYVAIRIFKEDPAGDPSFKEGLRGAAALKHPNVAACYAVDQEGNVTYAVTELLEGKTLKTILREKAALSVENKLAIMIQIADGLEHAHKNGIVHNNLRPGNIHLTPGGIIKIRDFGMAAQGEARAYLAPERILGKASDKRADIFSAGIVFYELLTSVYPFLDPNGAADPEDLLLHSDIGTVERFPQIPVGFWPIVVTSLHKDPKDRYSGMDQVGGACRELLKDLAEDCDLMLKELRAATPLLKRAVEIPGSGIKFALLVRQIERTLAAGADHASLQSLTMSLGEHQGFLRLVAERMPTGALAMGEPAIPVVLPYGIQAGIPKGSGAVPAPSQPSPGSSAASAFDSSSDIGGASLDEAELLLRHASRHGLGDPAGVASFGETNLVRQSGEIAIPEASLPPRNPEGAHSSGEGRAPQQPLTPLDAEKSTEKSDSETGAVDARPLTPGPQAIQGDLSDRRDPVERVAGSLWWLPRRALQVAAAILLVLLAATVWMQVRNRISHAKMAIEPAWLRLNPKHFNEAFPSSLAQAPANPEAMAILEKAQNVKRLDSLLREAQDLWVRGRLVETKARLHSVLELDPGSKPALRLLHQVTDIEDLKSLQLRVKGLVTSASALIRQENLDKAKAQLDLARLLLPDDQGVLVARRGWAEKSADVFSQKKEKQEPANADEERVRSAHELYRQGRYEEAKSLLERGPAEEAEDAQVLRTRVADAQRALKSYKVSLSEQRYEDALNEFRKLEQLNPADPTVAAVRQQLESGKTSGKALLTVYRLGEPGFITLDGQRLDSDGEVEKRSIVTGNHLLAVRNERGFEATRIQEFRAGQNTVFVYDAANTVLREMRDGDQELLSNRKN